MTRENKVALVIGFALVLFVGILVSDHLSKAQTQRSADLVPAVNTRTTMDARPARFVDLRTTLPSRPSKPAPLVPQPVTPEPATSPMPAAPVTAPLVVAERSHEVRPGESLSTICQQAYGTASLTQALAAHNDISDPDRVRAGRRLSLPAVEVLDGDAGTREATPGGGEHEELPEWRTYRIKDGDSLSEIARRFMGSAGRWQQLYELNRQAISDPDNIRAGTVLKVPNG